MTSSLVGSEMCIRDSRNGPSHSCAQGQEDMPPPSAHGRRGGSKLSEFRVGEAKHYRARLHLSRRFHRRDPTHAH
eukprot:9820495-Prorocentrum_lima.AAC.1